MRYGEGVMEGVVDDVVRRVYQRVSDAANVKS